MTPGIHPRILSKMLIRKLESQPVLKKTASGGRKRARKYRQTSLYNTHTETVLVSVRSFTDSKTGDGGIGRSCGRTGHTVEEGGGAIVSGACTLDSDRFFFSFTVLARVRSRWITGVRRGLYLRNAYSRMSQQCKKYSVSPAGW